MVTKTRCLRPMKLIHGAGDIYEVPGEKVIDLRGSMVDALVRIVREEIREPELMQTLKDKKLVIQSLNGAAGEVHQQNVSPQTDFAKFAAKLEEQTLALSVSVNHDGGCADRGR